jgi:hypothetical protein
MACLEIRGEEVAVSSRSSAKKISTGDGGDDGDVE